MRFQAISFSLFTSYSLLVTAQIFPNSTNGPSCGALKADDTFFSVVGIQFTGIEPRRELRELEKDSEVWNMFLQALARFQAMDEKDKVSYFQIASTTTLATMQNIHY
jgi:tyrosinase